MRIEPAPSEPNAAPTSPAATAAAEPPLDPPGVCPSDHGLRVVPNASVSVNGCAVSSGTCVLPMTIAPAARSRRTTSASRSAGGLSWSTPSPVTSPATSVSSLIATGTPSSGRWSPCLRRASACWASTRARSAMTTRKAFSVGSRRSMRSRYVSTSSRGATSALRTSSA